MRTALIMFPTSEGDSLYHLMTRTVNGEFLFDDTDKEMLRKIIIQVADYCGVDALTYALLCNHLHLLLMIFRAAPVADAELLRRYGVLYPTPTKYQAARLEVIQAQLETNGPEAVAWRQRQLRLMGDVSSFMKLVKQRFTIWYNRTHHRFGTLWAERYKSVLLENDAPAILPTAVYIDLNAVRAGIVEDPKDYHFCGYAAAVAGDLRAQRGIMAITRCATWADAQAVYRQVMFGTAAGAREHGKVLSVEAFEKVAKEGGKLPLATVLRCRLRYLTATAVLGSRLFVEAQLAAYRRNTGLRLNRGPRPLPGFTDWKGLVALRGLRRRAFT
ncbi:MAG: Transposase like protein [Verrucomicrobia bacterium]|nr:Transposase like protein [Verrucomicrobiota bacterium]